MIDPMAFASPQQRQKLAEMQAVTRNITYIVHTEDEANRVEVTLESEDPQAAQVIPQIREAVVDSITQTLYTMFAMSGKRR